VKITLFKTLQAQAMTMKSRKAVTFGTMKTPVVCVTSTAILIHLSAVVFSVAAFMAVFYDVSFVALVS
jgi:hypothetical protein